MLHETTQRRICRITFLAGCALPTLIVVVAAARVWLPGYATQWELPLGQLLDCTTTIDRFEMPRPGVVRFGSVVLADSETDTPWAYLFGVSHEASPERSVISVEKARITDESVVAIGERIERLLRDKFPREAALTIANLEVTSESQSLTVPHVSLRISTGETGGQMRFWTGDAKEGLRLQVNRNRQLDPPATSLTLQTGSEGIPCWLLGAWDRFDELGPISRFQGRLELIASQASTRGRISGRFTHLDRSHELAVNELDWNSEQTDFLISPHYTGPVAAVLAQLPHDPPLDSTSDIGWQLAPFPQRANVAVHKERILK